jgi:hypothetical protein
MTMMMMMTTTATTTMDVARFEAYNCMTFIIGGMAEGREKSLMGGE